MEKPNRESWHTLIPFPIMCQHRDHRSNNCKRSIGGVAESWSDNIGAPWIFFDYGCLQGSATIWLAVSIKYIRSVYISMPPQKRTINEELVAQYENKEIWTENAELQRQQLHSQGRTHSPFTVMACFWEGCRQIERKKKRSTNNVRWRTIHQMRYVVPEERFWQITRGKHNTRHVYSVVTDAKVPVIYFVSKVRHTDHACGFRGFHVRINIQIGGHLVARDRPWINSWGGFLTFEL